jgi:hypothetical protein
LNKVERRQKSNAPALSGMVATANNEAFAFVVF